MLSCALGKYFLTQCWRSLDRIPLDRSQVASKPGGNGLQCSADTVHSARQCSNRLFLLTERELALHPNATSIQPQRRRTHRAQEEHPARELRDIRNTPENISHRTNPPADSPSPPATNPLSPRAEMFVGAMPNRRDHPCSVQTESQPVSVDGVSTCEFGNTQTHMDAALGSPLSWVL